MNNSIRLTLLSTLALSLLTISLPVGAQTKSGTMADNTMKNGAGMPTLSPADERFIKESAMTNLTEIKLGELAQQKGESNEVKSFGQRMVTDHTAAQNSLAPIAEKAGIQLPTTLNAASKSKYDKLSKLSGRKFDVTYMDEMVAGHSKVASDMKHQESVLKNPDVKNWDTTTLKTVEEHKKLAIDTDKAVDRSTAQGEAKTKSGGTSSHY